MRLTRWILGPRYGLACLLLLAIVPALPAQSGTNGVTFTVLHAFTGGTDGGYPKVAGVLQPGTLYGTAESGGVNGEGSIFAVNTDGIGLTILHSFSYTGTSDGNKPYANLVALGNTLYGTTSEGGSSGYGTIFKVSINGTGFGVLHMFRPRFISNRT